MTRRPRKTQAATTAGSLDTVLVTGAGGCVGGLVVEELLRRGLHVIASDRPGVRLPAPQDRLTLRPADLTAPAGIPALVAGAQAVIHTAAVVDIARSWEELEPINVRAAERLYEAAAAAGARAFVHFSSGSIYAAKEGPLREDDPLAPGSPYERSKVVSEERLLSQPAGGPRLVILRPALIFGPLGTVLLAALATLPYLLARATPALPRLRGGPRTNSVHALDVARAAVHLLLAVLPDRQIYNVANNDPLPFGDYYTIAVEEAGGRLIGPPLPLWTAPIGLLYPRYIPSAAISGLNLATTALWRRLAAAEGLTGPLAPRFDKEALAYAAGDMIFDTDKLAATGFAWTYPDFRSGWRATQAWYRQERWVPERVRHLV